jgi:hypothetical protein
MEKEWLAHPPGKGILLISLMTGDRTIPIAIHFNPRD